MSDDRPATSKSEAIESVDSNQQQNIPAPSEAKSASVQQHEQSSKVLEELSKEMIKTTSEYIKGEIEICAADYKTLEQMNKLVTEKYKQLGKNSSNIIAEMDRLNDSYATLLPMLSQIDDVEKSVEKLESSAAKLDAYSKRLEAKFKQFTDKYLNK